MGEVGHTARGTGEFAGCHAIEGGYFGCQSAETSDLDLTLARGVLEMGVVALQVVVIFAQLVEACGFDEHAGIGAGQAGDREDTNKCCCCNQVGVMKGNRNLGERAVGLAAHEHDVVTLFEAQKTARDARICPRGGGSREAAIA